MEDPRKTVKEIGIFEMSHNLALVSDSSVIQEKVGGTMPLPDSNVETRLECAAQWLAEFGKNRYLFLLPEIALIEKIAAINKNAEVYIAVPWNLDEEAKIRLENNLPKDVSVTVLEETYAPRNFSPHNGIMVVSGYSAAGHLMVLPDTYRMLENYSGSKGFFGRKVFVPYKELEVAERYEGWMEVNAQLISEGWRYSK